MKAFPVALLILSMPVAGGLRAQDEERALTDVHGKVIREILA